MHKDSAACFRCRTQQENLNNNWKGGRAYHKAGYVMVLVKEHPRATSGGGRYVFEHILVMEELLGRYLEPDETVHHINGIKDDNRPANLELWVRPQPAGIRMQDAVNWAQEILNRYEGVVTSNDTHRNGEHSWN